MTTTALLERRHVVRGLLIAATPLVAAAMLFLAPTIARADSASSLTVVGTSDVSDSGLMQNVIQPRFHAAFPAYTFKYIGTATGNAINSATSGSQGASVLIVHAPSLENQFVANGFSEEPFGRAIWINDFVFAGPTADPAAVGTDGSNNIAQAFADVAKAGYNKGGTPAATFVSRGGTPGTTVQEHQIWQLVDSSGLRPNGVILCGLSTANGGGETPIASGNDGDPCPNNGAVPTTGLPAWYVSTGLTQGPNVVAANTCNFASPSNTCYVFTDRGTYDYLSAGNGAAAANNPAGIPSLKIVTRGPQPATAPGGAFALTNYFHAYIINPSKPNETVNLTAAQDFVNLITSPDVQGQLQFYLNSTTDPAGPPFIADASPTITASGLPGTATAGHPVTVTGTVTNAQPGFAVIDNKPVAVNEIVGGFPIPVGSGTTDSTGHYSVTFTPTSSGSYQVSTGQIQQIEKGSLSPAFGDILSPAASNAITMNVHSAVALSTAKASAGGFTVTGKLTPGSPDANGRVTLLARHQGSKGAFSHVGGGSLTTGQSTFGFSGGVRPGKWQVEVSYSDPGRLVSSTSTSRNVTVPTASTTVSFNKISVKNGNLTVSGKLSQGPTASSARVTLLGLRTTTVKLTKTKKTTHKTTRHAPLARAAAVGFSQVTHVTVKSGKTTFTIHAKLKRGYRWVLQLEYRQSGQPTSDSRARTVDVH
jgi:tungstate transport system substrate-binding protein